MKLLQLLTKFKIELRVQINLTKIIRIKNRINSIRTVIKSPITKQIPEKNFDFSTNKRVMIWMIIKRKIKIYLNNNAVIITVNIVLMNFISKKYIN